MSSILTCPACNEQVSLPEGQVDRWLCPYCQNELKLSAELAPAEAPPQQYLIPTAIPQSQPIVAATPPGSAVAEYRKRAARQAQRPSMLGQMVGIMAGGALGMVIGYWLLNFFGGPKYNFLSVSLPFVDHSQKAAARPKPPPVTDPLMQEEEPPARRPKPQHEAPLAHAPSSPHVVEPPVAVPPTVSFPRYTSDDLGEALAAAQAVAGCENCQSTGFLKKGVPCPVCGGKPSGRVTAEVYAKFCRLSEVITFVDGDPEDPQLARRKEAIEQIFLRSAADREKQAALGRMASHHLKDPQPPTNGILLAGTVQEVGRAGDYHSTRLLLFGLGEEVTVVSDSPVRAKPQARMLLAGSIVDQPRQRLAGYTGTASQIVFGGFHVILPEAR